MATALMLLGRPAEASTVLEAARPRLAAKDGFRDGDTQINWWWDNLERAQAALGQYDAALASLREGSRRTEGGGANVSQLINLAYLQYRFGHPVEALTTLATFAAAKRETSPVGEMEMRGARACSLFALGRGMEAEADVAYARAHAADDPGTAEDILLCAGDADGAAALLIRRLADPALRDAALLRLCDFDPPPGGEPNPFNDRYAALKARGDVQAAIARAGGIRRFHLQRSPS